MIDCYDSNNWVRIKFETGQMLRDLYIEVFHRPVSFFVFDGKNAKAIRKAIYEGYKLNKTPAPDNFYLMLGVFKELLLHTHHIIIDVPGYEGDDVINTLAKTQDLNIFSTDRDFCALHREGILTPMANLKGVAAHEVRLYKTLVGDTTDSISGIVGFGRKAWESLTEEHKVQWLIFLRGGEAPPSAHLGLLKPGHVVWYEKNQELLRCFWKVIGFFEIPTELLALHIKNGTPNWARGDALLKEMVQ